MCWYLYAIGNMIIWRTENLSSYFVSWVREWQANWLIEHRRMLLYHPSSYRTREDTHYCIPPNLGPEVLNSGLQAAQQVLNPLSHLSSLSDFLLLLGDAGAVLRICPGPCASYTWTLHPIPTALPTDEFRIKPQNQKTMLFGIWRSENKTVLLSKVRGQIKLEPLN